ncbi:MAG: ABC transporter permease subunit [Firmicutes bacterium]|nr:ABC transporter permease subunit [Candidatus Colivicinus equi]
MYKKNNSLVIFLLLFYSVSIVIPFLSLCTNIEAGTLTELLASEQFKSALANSLVVTSISTVISLIVAYVLAFTLNRTNIKYKNLLQILFTLPMLIPSISHGIGFINLFGTNGLICDLNIFGIKGIVMGSVMYSFSTAFLMFNDAYKYIDYGLYENAKVLGMNKWETFKKITLPAMSKSFLPALFAVFTLVFTDYGVPLTIGGNYVTLPVYLYKQVIGLLDFSKGTVIGVFLLIPAFISFVLDLIKKDHEMNDSVVKSYSIEQNKPRDLIFGILSYLVIILMCLILGSFIYISFMNKYPSDTSLSLAHFKYLLDNDILKYLTNSLIIAIFTSIFGVIIAYLAAFVSSRSENRLKKIVHILAIVSMSIPGIVLGLSYVLAFKKTFIYNTFIIIVLCNMVHFSSSPYMMAYNALNKVNKTYEDLGITYSITSIKILFKVLIPITKNTILEMFSYMFVNSMMTISAVAFLYTSSTMPIQLLINRYENSLMMEETAIISLVILVVNLLVKFIVYLLQNNKITRGQNDEVID